MRSVLCVLLVALVHDLASASAALHRRSPINEEWGDVAPWERQWLGALFQSTNGLWWQRRDRWLEGDPCKRAWYGLTCRTDPRTGRHTITKIILRMNNLIGTLPDFVDPQMAREHKEGKYTAILGLRDKKLPAHVMHDLAKSYLRGPPPSMLPNLEELRLDDNGDLRGPIRATIGSLESLRVLSLEFCDFSGSVPTTIGWLRKLEELYLTENLLDGVLPDGIGDLRSLRKLHLNVNDFVGPLPDTMAALTNLEELWIGFNHFGGIINGTTFSKLRRLEWFVAPKNEFEGPIPAEFALLPRLRVFDVLDNPQLTGVLPMSLQKRFHRGLLALDYQEYLTGHPSVNT